MLLTANIFQPLIDVFEAVLKFFHNSVGVPWGWSIVLLTVTIRVILLPLTLKQFKSMQALQRLQPEMKALQAKYKEDKQRQQQELMKFYKDNNVNPLGSCLPMVAQLPVFISLFYMLRKSLRGDICQGIQTSFQKAYAAKHGISLHAAAAQTTPCGPHGGAGFLFINDLTNKSSGAVLVVLIVLYIGTQLGSSLLMSSPTMDPTQRKIMMFMPLLFVLFVINFPSGVIVYWITTNSWTIAQQYIVKRRIGPMGPPAVVVGPSGGGGNGGGGSRPKGGSSGLGGTSNGGSGENGESGGNGLGGLTGLLRGRAKGETVTEKAAVGGNRSGTVVPPRPPKKKKKRSGRRR